MGYILSLYEGPDLRLTPRTTARTKNGEDTKPLQPNRNSGKPPKPGRLVEGPIVTNFLKNCLCSARIPESSVRLLSFRCFDAMDGGISTRTM